MIRRLCSWLAGIRDEAHAEAQRMGVMPQPQFAPGEVEDPVLSRAVVYRARAEGMQRLCECGEWMFCIDEAGPYCSHCGTRPET
jgi:hypothetical protein